MGIRGFAAREFFRRSLVRKVAAARLRGVPDLSHLAIYNELVLGPLQRDEALFLYGLVRTVRPSTVLEFGFLRGHSALNFMQALDDDARLYSVDIDPNAADRARERFGGDPRFRFILKSQADLEVGDVDGRQVDFVFLDALHDLELNKATFQRLLPVLAPDAIIAIHDTGVVPRELFPDWHPLLNTTDDWIGGDYEGQPGERAFVNWLYDQGGYAQIHLHSRRTLRCGITLIQRAARLPRSETPSAPPSVTA